MISKCTTGCAMVTPFVVAVPAGAGLLVTTAMARETHRRAISGICHHAKVRGADAGPPVPRAVSVLPARRPGLAAAHPSLASGPAGLGDRRFRGNAPARHA